MNEEKLPTANKGEGSSDLTHSELRNSLYGFEMREPDLRRSNREGSQNIKQLWQVSHEIINLALQGIKQNDIAKILGLSPSTVSNTLNSDLGIEKLSEMRKKRDEDVIDVARKVAELSEKALAVYEEIFDKKGVSLELKKETADTLLMDLGGHRAPTKIDSRTLSATVSLEEIEDFKRRGIAAAKASGMLVELPTNKKINGQKEQKEEEKHVEG